MGQGTLIFIDDQDKINASISAKGFANNEIKNRAYFNSIGANLVSKYLVSENINAKEGIHSIKKVLEEIDVSDIILPNIRIDVRTVFDENVIFIPKSHFEYDILPDIYVVVKPEKDLSGIEILGFFEPKLINKNNANDKYYFLEKEKLNPSNDLINYIKSFNGNENPELSEEELETSESIIMAFSDNDINENEKNVLIKQLTKSALLREKFIEYENFETLSYKAMTDSMIDIPELPKDTNTVDEFEIFETTDNEPASEDILIVEDVVSEPIEEVVENQTGNDFEPINETPVIEDSFVETENIQPEGTIIENINSADENVIEDVVDITNLAGAAAGLDAIEKVSDSMENILFDNETNEAMKKIDLINTEDDIPQLDISAKENVVLDENEQPEEIIDVEDSVVVEPIDVSNTDNVGEIENIDNKLSFEDIVVPEDEIAENVENVETIEDIDNKLSFEDVIINQDDSTIENDNISEKNSDNKSYEMYQNESFGKSLLENLNAEDIDNIIIEGVDENGSPAITSKDLLSEIDDALSSTSGNSYFTIENTEEKMEEETTKEITEESKLEETEEKAEEEITAETENTEEESKLDVLYNESNQANTENELEEISDYETSEYESEQTTENVETNNINNLQKYTNNKRTLIVAGVLAVVLLGISISAFMKPKNNSDINSTANMETLSETETANSENNTGDNISQENILESNAPKDVMTEQVQPVQKSDIQEMKNTTKAPVSSGVYMSVSKLAWNIPANVSIDKTTEQYLKSVGKSIKLSLSTDLLLATEYAYTNLVKINIPIGANGNIQNVSISSSSGSKEIDNIVLRTVNDTLKALKPPSNANNGQPMNLTLIIYF